MKRILGTMSFDERQLADNIRDKMLQVRMELEVCRQQNGPSVSVRFLVFDFFCPHFSAHFFQIFLCPSVSVLLRMNPLVLYGCIEVFVGKMVRICPPISKLLIFFGPHFSAHLRTILHYFG